MPIADIFTVMGNIQPDALIVLKLAKDYINKGGDFTEQERVSTEAKIGLGFAALFAIAAIRILDDKNNSEKN